MTSIHDLTAVEQAGAVRTKVLSPVEITDHYLARIDLLNSQLGAYVTIAAERAKEQAIAAEKAVLEAPDGLPPLHGVPVPIKDLNMVAGIPVTLGSQAYPDLLGFVDDTVVTRLAAAGTIMLGKTNTPEFGLSCYTENAVAPPARTPWDLTRSAGGSSGGAAAAVAAGLAPAAQGSDGGGSIRIPASACGLFGIKPTRGRISHGPIVPDLFGLSANGPIARTVRDAAALLDAMAGPAPGDMYRAPEAREPFSAWADRDPGRLRIARTLETAVPGVEVHPDCLRAYEEASALLAELGHEVVELPGGLVSGELVAPFEQLWSVLALLTPVAPEREATLLPLTRWLRDRGAEVSALDLLTGQAQLQAAMRRALPVTDTFDAILQPTLAQPPAPLGHFTEADAETDFERQKAFTPYTSLYNITGQPAVSVPLHWTADGLPIGIMLAGRLGEEGLLISLSAQLEAARPWAARKPAMW